MTTYHFSIASNSIIVVREMGRTSFTIEITKDKQDRRNSIDITQLIQRDIFYLIK